MPISNDLPDSRDVSALREQRMLLPICPSPSPTRGEGSWHIARIRTMYVFLRVVQMMADAESGRSGCEVDTRPDACHSDSLA